MSFKLTILGVEVSKKSKCYSQENTMAKKGKRKSRMSPQQAKFKRSAKKCKGKPSFKKCMSKNLKK